jgi:hypothetical protein
LPVVKGDSASGPTGGGTSRGYACTRLVPAAQGGLPPTPIRGPASALREYAIRRISFWIERVPPTCPASTPDPVTAWMAVTGSGVSPRQATFEAPALPANRRSRRQPPGRTRDSTPLSENYTPIPSPVPARLRKATPRTSLVRAAAWSSNALPTALGPTAPQIRAPASHTGRRWRSPVANAVVRTGDSARVHPWRTSSPTPSKSSSAAYDVKPHAVPLAHHPGDAVVRRAQRDS